MRLKKNYINLIAMLLSMAFLCTAIVVAEKKFKAKTYASLSIRLVNGNVDNLISAEQIKKLLENSNLQGLLRNINCYNIVNHHIKNIFIRKATCYKTWLGGINVEVLVKKPIARLQYIVGQDKYVDEFGEVIPLSKNFSFRVPIFQINEASLQKTENLKNTEYGMRLFSLIKYIYENLALNAQIAYSIVQSNGNIELYSQIGGQCIEFGKPEGIEEKIEKLKLFYRKIAPYKGWDFYKKVSLQFENQIVCE